MDIKKRFGATVKQVRIRVGISQEELALRIEADQAYVSRLEAGNMNVTLETIEQIADALEVKVRSLL
ncbi:MAG: helix-turn-helix domain-containing protein [Rhizobiaceae bacterium]|nr:helix-turn-helix domain-containing protein [Rhizobiaceae bacterium]